MKEILGEIDGCALSTKHTPQIEIDHDASDLNAKHISIVKNIEAKLKSHLAWSLDRVCVRGDKGPLLSDSNTVVPDIWVEALSENPTQSHHVTETVLAIVVVDMLTESQKSASLKKFQSIAGIKEFALVSIQDNNFEYFKKNEQGWSAYSGEREQ